MILEHEPFRLKDGWYCLVAGRVFGPWPDKGSASAGRATEQRRAARKVTLASAPR